MAIVGLAVAGAATATYVTAAVTGAVIGGIVIGAVGAAAIGAVAGAAVSMILSGALIDEPSAGNFSATAKNILLNKRANNEPIPVIYGTRVVGGTIVYLRASTGPSTRYLEVSLVICEGVVDSLGEVKLDGFFITDDKFNFGTGKKSYAQYKQGTETQPASSILQFLNHYTSAHKLKGTAYIALSLYYTPSAFPNGLPTMTTEVKGIKVYDPRTTLTQWSDNPALCIRDYLTNSRYGRDIAENLIDDASFTIVANYCDELVTINEVSQKRYICNGVVDTQNSSLDILKKLLSSCRGFLVFSAGKYKLIADKPEIAEFTFSEDNIIGGWTIQLGGKNTKFNKIMANFFNEAKEWQPDLAVIESTELREQDGGVLLEKTIDLPFTSSLTGAKIIAVMNMNQSRQSITCEFTATIEALRVEVGDVVYVSHATPGWDVLNNNQGKKFRVMRLAIMNKDEVRVILVEYSDSVYDFGVIEGTDATPDSSLPDSSTAIPPTDLSVVETQYTTQTGTKTRLHIRWTASIDSFVSHYEVMYKSKNATEWSLVTYTSYVGTILSNVSPGMIEVRVRTINTVGVASEWLE